MNFTQQYGKNRQRRQQNTFYYAVRQLLLYFYREFPSKILSVYISSQETLCTLYPLSIARAEFCESITKWKEYFCFWEEHF